MPGAVAVHEVGAPRCTAAATDGGPPSHWRRGDAWRATEQARKPIKAPSYLCANCSQAEPVTATPTGIPLLSNSKPGRRAPARAAKPRVMN